MSTMKSTPTGSSGIVRAMVRFIILILFFPAILFGSAGTVNWPMGWAYILMSLGFVVGSRLVLARKHPDLIKERAESGAGAKEWDKLLVWLVAIIGPLAALIVAGLDHRYQWSPDLGLAMQVAALLVLALGTLFSTWAMLENRFFSGVVRIQKERGHCVVSTGPYRFVRHPGYTGGIIANLAGPLALGSLWALIPGGLLVVLVIIRTILEDRTLHDELDGYSE